MKTTSSFDELMQKLFQIGGPTPDKEMYYRVLDDVWRRQMSFTENFAVSDVIGYTKEMALGIVSEIDELLEAVGRWKNHRNEDKPIIISGMLEECVDIFKYLLNILLSVGVSPEAFVTEFTRKSVVVEERFVWERRLAQICMVSKVAFIDLDGVLTEYPENWLAYLREYKYVVDIDAYCLEPHCPSIPRRAYLQLKHVFRDTGNESWYVKCIEDAKAFLIGLKSRGYLIVILSARPYKQYKRIQSDTIMWMKSNGLLYDAFIWSRDKAEAALRVLRDNSETTNRAIVVDDELATVLEAGSAGIKSFLVDKPYNKDSRDAGTYWRVQTLHDVLQVIDHG